LDCLGSAVEHVGVDGIEAPCQRTPGKGAANLLPDVVGLFLPGVSTLEKQGLLEVAYNGRPRRYRLAIEHRRNKILRAARAIPVGRWASYGDVGIAATGNRNAARAVARSAARNPAFPTPWRVINGNATIPDGWHSGDGQGPEKCRALLEGEGIRFEDGKADPSHRIGWEELEPLIEADELPTEAPA
jgi:alkylated DNA nucleotide flippase Atl1